MEAREIEFITSKRGGSLLKDGNGYLFTFEKLSKSNDQKKFWKCTQAYSKPEGCPVRVHSIGNMLVWQSPHEHNHEPSPAEIEAKQLCNEVKRRAQENVELLPGQIKNNVIQGVGPAILAKMPSDNAIRRMVERARNPEENFGDPDSFETLVIPNEYKLFEGQNFLLVDTGEAIRDPTRIIIFGKESVNNWINLVENLYIDGTFKISPRPYHNGQLLMVLGKRNGHVLPLYYCLLPNKTRAIYDKLFAELKRVSPLLDFLSCATDFEISLFESAKAAFPNTQIHGCFYHLNNSLKKKSVNSL